MYLLNSDYCEGAHPEVLDALIDTNGEQTEGYEEDPHCRHAAELICNAIGQDAAVWFLTGGTQTNFTFLSHLLKPWEAVIAAPTGHICTHETGAVEACGHKVLTTAPHSDGKLRPEDLQAVVDAHTDHHMVAPKAVYLSHPTELGTIYTEEELTAISRFCHDNGLYLYLDGARLAMGLTARDADLTLTTIAALCDAFYIGGTKCGALFGEALVITHPTLAEGFNYSIKQRGGLLAKGRLLGVQFEALFTNDLYSRIGRHANQMADGLRTVLTEAGCSFLTETTTNQLFVILPDRVIAALKTAFDFRDWVKIDADTTAVRLVTSYATPASVVTDFAAALKAALSC